jgi:phosphate-selective porin OprO/OprP
MTKALAIGLTLALAIHCGVGAQSQQPPATRPPAPPESIHPDTDYVPPDKTEPARMPATGFVVPDVPDDWNKKTTYDGRLFSTRLSVAAIVDYSAFTQDDNSVRQVGAQKNQWDVRTFRIIPSGQIKTPHPISYLISLEVKGQDHVLEGESSVGFTDWEFGTSLGRLGTIKYGKVKEPFVYEMVGDAANLQQQERILSPFFVSRGIGLRWGNSMAHDRMTWSAGWFNDWWIENVGFTSSGNDYAGRVTGLPGWSDGGANYIALGVSARHSDAAQGTLRFRGRPESNTTSYYVDTGDLPANHARELGLEALVGRGPFLLSSEYVRAWVDSPEKADPHVWGGYVTVSYVLTGEHRPYDRKVGYARRVMPEGRWGAWEVFGRYSHVDLDDRLVAGGVMDKGALGLNWWATRRWKIGFDYGRTGLDRDGVHGVTHAFHTRFQWVY